MPSKRRRRSNMYTVPVPDVVDCGREYSPVPLVLVTRYSLLSFTLLPLIHPSTAPRPRLHPRLHPRSHATAVHDAPPTFPRIREFAKC
jgi:hypothetical protein